MLLAEYKDKHGKDLKPVQCRNGKQVSSHIRCPNVLPHMRFFTTIMGVRDSILVKSAKRILISKIDSLKS